MSVIDDLLATLSDAPVRELCVGPFWTAVVVDADGRRRCGLASTPHADDDHHHGGGAAVRDAGPLAGRSAGELAELARSQSSMEAAIGMAAINALLPPHEDQWVDLNAEEVIAEHAANEEIEIMKIALPSKGPSLDTPVSPAFGRCQFFLFADTENGLSEAVPNPYGDAERDAGVQAAQLVVDHGAEAVITPLIGQYARRILEEAGVAIYELELESGQSALDRFRSDRLEASGVGKG